MKAILMFLLAGTASPAIAQQTGSAAPTPPASSSTACTPEHAAMGHCKMPATTAPAANPAAPTPATGASCTPEHAAMGHCTMPTPAAPAATPAAPTPETGTTCTLEHAAMGHCKMPAPAATPANPAPPTPATSTNCTPEHAAMGHCTIPAPAAPQADPHAGHDMGSTAPVPAPPTAPPPPAALAGPAHAADQIYGAVDMAEAREVLRKEHGSITTFKFLVDQAEIKVRDGRDGYGWDAQAWYGGDINKLWIKSEGEGVFREGVEKAEVQALWSRAIDPWFDLQLGIRHDFRPDPERTHLVLGVQGLAPYWFEVDGALFLSDKGDVTARFEGEYDLRITQKLILQPRVEIELALQDVPETGIGSGFSFGEIGARLRYEIKPEFAPYIGVEYERAFGDTARFSRAGGEDVGGWSFLVGLRTWF